VEDVLARRIRLLFLDAKAAMEAAPKIAGMLASLTGKNKEWEKEQLVAFNQLALSYLLQ
jgi:glycerol-3-phosphate dehydrogenase